MTSKPKINKVNELEHFLEELEKYLGYIYLHKKSGLTKKKATEALELRDALLQYAGRYKGLITELTGKEEVTLVRRRKGYPVEEHPADMWIVALKIPYNSLTDKALSRCDRCYTYGGR